MLHTLLTMWLSKPNIPISYADTIVLYSNVHAHVGVNAQYSDLKGSGRILPGHIKFIARIFSPLPIYLSASVPTMFQEIQIAVEIHVAVTTSVPTMFQEIQIAVEIHVAVTARSINSTSFSPIFRFRMSILMWMRSTFLLLCQRCSKRFVHRRLSNIFIRIDIAHVAPVDEITHIDNLAEVTGDDTMNVDDVQLEKVVQKSIDIRTLGTQGEQQSKKPRIDAAVPPLSPSTEIVSPTRPPLSPSLSPTRPPTDGSDASHCAVCGGLIRGVLFSYKGQPCHFGCQGQDTMDLELPPTKRQRGAMTAAEADLNQQSSEVSEQASPNSTVAAQPNLPLLPPPTPPQTGTLPVRPAGFKPTPLRNWNHEDWGAGSCYLNAGIQAVMAIEQIQHIMEAHFKNREGALTTNINLWEMPKDSHTTLHPTRIKKVLDVACRHDDLLAATWRAMTQELSGERTRSYHIPRTIPAKFYEGPQEDAGEFLQRLLNEKKSVTTTPVLRGLDSPILSCTGPHCTYKRPAADEAFTSLSLSLITNDGRLYATVQHALDAYFADELINDKDFRWSTADRACPECRGNTLPSKKHRIVAYPGALWLQLNRWRHRHGNGVILDPIHPNLNLQLGDQRYVLRSIIFHQGLESKSGHYITIAYHSHKWWLYNDASRREASHEEVQGTCEYLVKLMEANKTP